MTESLFEASSLKQQQELVEYLKKKKNHILSSPHEKKNSSKSVQLNPNVQEVKKKCNSN